MRNVRSATIRKEKRDPGLTIRERRKKAELMRQFCRLEGSTNTAAYLTAHCWCACGRLKAEGRKKCARCLGGRG